MSVSHRYLDRFVPHQLLRCTDINSGHDKAASECMPEIMPVEVCYTPVGKLRGGALCYFNPTALAQRR